MSTAKGWKKMRESKRPLKYLKFNDFFFYSLRITRFVLDRMCYNWHRLPFLSEIDDDGLWKLTTQKKNYYQNQNQITRNYSTETLNEHKNTNSARVRALTSGFYIIRVQRRAHTRDTLTLYDVLKYYYNIMYIYTA